MVPSGRWRRSGRRTDWLAAAGFVTFLLSPHAMAGLQPPAPLDLQLEVSINGQPANLIGAFRLEGHDRILATREELSAVGITAPGPGQPDDIIALGDIPGLTYRYDERAQAINLEVTDDLRKVKTYGGPQGEDDAGPQAETASGLIVNYTAFAEGSHSFNAGTSAINGGSLALDAKAFSKLGTLSQSGLIGTSTFSDATALRLDTVWSYADETNMRNFRAGDIVSGELGWTRPIRLGGAQVQRNFALRPSLVTEPLPAFSGNAALPSTVDVYVGNVKTYSQSVDAGPYRIENLPVITGSGTARIVTTDSSGRETESEADFFTSANLLRKGLYDYSIDGGVARRGFGTESFDYDDRPAAMASLRLGITDWLTGEAHAETDFAMVNGGVGFVAGLGKLGELSGAAAVSSHDGIGLLVFGGWQMDYESFSLNASTRRSFGPYADLASVTATDSNGLGNLIDLEARAIDQISLSYGFADLKASAGLGLVHVENSDGRHAMIVSGTLTKSFDNNLSIYASGFADFGEDSAKGGFIGASFPFGKTYSTSANASLVDGRVTGATTVVRNAGGDPGGYGWRVTHGEGGNSYTAASASYRASKAYLQADAYQQGSAASLSATADGAIAVAGGGVFLSTRIDDGFAIVDAGAEGVPVRLENRVAGVTGRDGKVLISGLNAYERNRLSLDIDQLPVTASVPMTETTVVPRENGGALVNFGIVAEQTAAIVIVTDAAGKPLPPGTAVTLQGQAEPFVAGYDGEVYVTGIAGETRFEAVVMASLCHGSFSIQPTQSGMAMIGPVKCV